MKRFILTFIVIGMLTSCLTSVALAQYSTDTEYSAPNEEMLISETIAFDSIREFVEWVHCCDSTKYNGDFGKLIEKIQVRGELFSVTSENKNTHGIINPKYGIITFYLRQNDSITIQLRMLDEPIAEKHADPAKYFSAKFPGIYLKKLSLDLMIDGERKTISAVSSTAEIGENKVSIETVAFLTDVFEVRISTWSSPINRDILNTLSFANLSLNEKCITNINNPSKHGVSCTWHKELTKNGLITCIDIDGFDEDSLLNNFEDVNREDPFAWAVILTSYHGIMTGTGEHTFSPHDTFTRAQFANALWRMSNCVDYYQYQQNEYCDLPPNEWYTLPMQWAAKNHLAKTSDGMLLEPQDAIPRQEFALFLYRYITNYQEMTYDGTPENYDEVYPKVEFSDAAEIADYAKEAVEHISRWGLMRGKSNGRFDPQSDITRAEAAIIISRIKHNFLSFGHVSTHE